MSIDSNDKIHVTRYNEVTGGGTQGTALQTEIQTSGWGDYVDGTYTEGSPFQPTTDQWTALPNDASSGPRFQEPEGIALFENGKITGRNGDAILITVEMTIKPTTASNTFVDTAIDIGGAVGRIYPRTLSFPKGQGAPRTISFTVGAYTLDTWEANGGEIQVNPTHAVDIYGIRTVVTRTHKAT